MMSRIASLGDFPACKIAVNLFRDGHFDLVFAGQRQATAQRIHAFRQPWRIFARFTQRTSFAQFDSNESIAAERAVQVRTNRPIPARPLSVFGPRPQAPPNGPFQRAAGVSAPPSIRARPRPMAAPAASCHHIFHRAGDSTPRTSSLV